jgi:catechol 2,3-dioxygenase-like lactoylglutathione lyase family enzyme
VEPPPTAEPLIAEPEPEPEPAEPQPTDAEPVDAAPVDAEPIDSERIDAEPVAVAPVDAEPAAVAPAVEDEPAAPPVAEPADGPADESTDESTTEPAAEPVDEPTAAETMARGESAVEPVVPSGAYFTGNGSGPTDRAAPPMAHLSGPVVVPAQPTAAEVSAAEAVADHAAPAADRAPEPVEQQESHEEPAAEAEPVDSPFLELVGPGTQPPVEAEPPAEAPEPPAPDSAAVESPAVEAPAVEPVREEEEEEPEATAQEAAEESGPSPEDPVDAQSVALVPQPAPPHLAPYFADQPEESTSGLSGVHNVSVTLIVADLRRSLTFYRDLLGLTEIDSGVGSAVLASGNARILLRQVTDTRPVDRRVVHLNLEVDDVHEAYDRLRRENVEFMHPPRVVNQGEQLEQWAATLRDPDGHAIALTRWEIRP